MKNDILQVAVGTVLLGILMDILFALFGKFGPSVFLGTLLGCGFTLLNFILLAISVSGAVEKQSGKTAGNFMRISYLLRLLLTAAMVIFAIKAPYINYLAAVIPLTFPQITILIRKGFLAKKSRSTEES